MAAALARGKVGLSELSDEFVQQPQVKQTMAKVQISTVDTQCDIEPVFAMHDRVQLQLNNGQTLDSGDIRFARGNAMLPLRPSDLKAKFLDCVQHAPLDGPKLFEQLSHLGQQADVRFAAAH